MFQLWLPVITLPSYILLHRNVSVVLLFVKLVLSALFPEIDLARLLNQVQYGRRGPDLGGVELVSLSGWLCGYIIRHRVLAINCKQF